MAEPLNPDLAYDQGYPYGQAAGMKAQADGVAQGDMLSKGPTPGDLHIPLPALGQSYQGAWSEAFSLGWHAGYVDAYETGQAAGGDTYKLGVAAGYPYGVAAGRGQRDLRVQGAGPVVEGRRPPPGWTTPEMGEWNMGFSSGWLLGFNDAVESGVSHLTFQPVFVPPRLRPVMPFFPREPQTAPSEDKSADDETFDSKDNASSSTPWIVGGVVALAAIGGTLWWWKKAADPLRANPLNQTKRKVNIVSHSTNRDGSKSFALFGLPGAQSLVWADSMGTILKDDYNASEPYGRYTRRLMQVELPVGTIIVWLDKKANGTVEKWAVELTDDNGESLPSGAVRASTIDDGVQMTSRTLGRSEARVYEDTITMLDGTVRTYRGAN